MARRRPQSVALSLQLQTLRNNVDDVEEDDDIPHRAAVCFEVLDKLIATSGPLKPSFDVVREELFHLVFSEDVTKNANSEMENIPFADLCKTFKKERDGVHTKVAEAEEMIEKKYAIVRRDMLNCQAEVEILRRKNKELVRIAQEEEDSIGSAKQQLMQQQKDWEMEKETHQNEIKVLKQKISQLEDVISNQDANILRLSRFENGFHHVSKVVNEKFKGIPPRGISKMSEQSMLKSLEVGDRSIVDQMMHLRMSIIGDVEQRILVNLRKSTNDVCSVGNRLAQFGKKLWAINYIPPVEDTENIRSLFSSVEKEIKQISHDADLAQTQLDYVNNRDMEEYKVKDKFYPQSLPSTPSTITTSSSFVPSTIPENVEKEMKKKLWKWISLRSPMLVFPTPRTISLELTEVYISELCLRSINEDMMVSTLKEEVHKSNVRHIHHGLMDMFDYFFPYEKAATHAYRDFLHSVCVHAPKSLLVQLMLDTISCKRDASVIRFYAIVAKIMHELNLSTPTHLQWFVEEIFSEAEFNVDEVLLNYTSACSNAFTRKTLTEFFLKYFLMEHKPLFFKRFRTFLEREGISILDPLPYAICEKAQKEFYPLASFKLLEALYQQSSKTVGGKAGVDSRSVAEMLDYIRLSLYADVFQECLRDRVENVSQQIMLERKRDRIEQLETDVASMLLLNKKK